MHKSSKEGGIFCLFVCGCGFRICDAYYVEVVHKNDDIIWKRVYSQTGVSDGRIIGSVNWTFNRVLYEETINMALHVSILVESVIKRSEQDAPSNR